MDSLLCDDVSCITDLHLTPFLLSVIHIVFVFVVQGTDGALPRCKPFKYTYEKEIVMYAYFKNLDYFSTECIYSPNAYR